MTDEIQITSMIGGWCLIAVVLAATVTDIASHRIPNRLLMPAFAIAVIIGAASSGLTGIAVSLAGLGVGLAMLLPLYAIGGMSAGDVKLLGVAGAFLGPGGALVAGIATFIAGSALGLIWIGWRLLRPVVHLQLHLLYGVGEQADRSLDAPESVASKNQFAYAPAIATGSVFAIWQQGWHIPFALG